MSRINLSLALLALVGLPVAISVSAPASSFAVENPDTYYSSGSERGFWFYEDPPKPEEKKEEKKKPAPAPQTTPESPYKLRNPSLSDYTYDQLWEMHPDDFYELQESFKKKAVQSPSEQNVTEYYEMQEIARKKSLAFTNASQYVWQKYPELSTASDNPVTIPGGLAQTTQINEEKQAKLRQYQNEFALIYFTKQGCKYCTEQTKINQWFKSQTGWTIKNVDVDDNRNLAAKLGITITPSLVLIQKGNDDFMPVSAGVVSATELEDRTYRAIRLLAKEVTPDQYGIYDFQKGGGYDTGIRDFATKRKGQRRQ